jgi:hypothetical protein
MGKGSFSVLEMYLISAKNGASKNEPKTLTPI